MGEKLVDIDRYKSFSGWFDFTCQLLDYFMPKTFLFPYFMVGYGCYLCCYLYIISVDSYVGNLIVGIVVWISLLLSGEVAISVDGFNIQV